MDEPDRDALQLLEPRFLEALQAKDQGRFDDAEEGLRGLLAIEPRLPEPRLELARLLLDSERTAEAEAHARQGLEDLVRSGGWTDEIDPDQLLALAKALLAEVLRRRADEDDVVFGDPAEFQALVRESQTLFAEAAALDPSDEYASYHAFFLGARGHGGAEAQADEEDDA